MFVVNRSVKVCILLALLSTVVGCGSLRNGSNPSVGTAPPQPVTGGPAPTPSPSPSPNTPSSTPAPIFAFWYQHWIPSTTPAELKPAEVVIGISPSAIAEVHATGKRVLQYQSYYQSKPNTILLKDSADLSNVGFEINHKFLLNVFGDPDSYVMCPNSVTFHARVHQLVQLALDEGYDGLMVDNTFFNPPAHQICDAAHAHLDPTAQGGRAFLTLLSEVRQMLRARNPNALLITNPGSPIWADMIATGSPTLWDLSDYVVWESYGYTAHTDSRHDGWDLAISRSYDLAATPSKAAKVLTLSYVLNATEAQYAFAVARFFGLSWTSNIGATPFGTYFNKIPFDLGEPVGSLPPLSPVLQRQFTHGEVFINTSVSAQTVNVPIGTMYLAGNKSEVTIPSQVALSPRTAAIVISH